MSNETNPKSKTEAPKAEAPKAEAPKAEPAANPFASMFGAFDPMAYWTQSQQAFQKLVSDAAWMQPQQAMQKLVGDAVGRAQAFADHYATMENHMVSRAHAAVASWAQMTQDAIAYAAQLSAEARKLGLETLRKAQPGA